MPSSTSPISFPELVPRIVRVYKYRHKNKMNMPIAT